MPIKRRQLNYHCLSVRSLSTERHFDSSSKIKTPRLPVSLQNILHVYFIMPVRFVPTGCDAFTASDTLSLSPL